MLFKNPAMTVYLFTILPWCVNAGAYSGNDQGSFTALEAQKGNSFEQPAVWKKVRLLCRSLGLDPGRKSAVENLGLILANPDMDAGRRSRIIAVEDSLAYIKILANKISYLIHKRDFLEQRVLIKGHDQRLISREFSAIRSACAAQGIVVVPGMSFEAVRDDPLADLEESVKRNKEFLLNEILCLEQQYKWLTKVDKNPEFQTYREFLDASLPVPRHTTEVAVLDVKKDSGRSEDRSMFLGDTRLSDQERSNGKINGEVVDLSLKVMEIQALLRDKMETIEALKAELLEVQQRFILEKRIIQEKDHEIEILQVKLAQIKAKETNAAETVSMPRDEQLAELRGILGIYKDKLTKKTQEGKEKSQDIEELEHKLDVIHQELKQKNNKLSRVQDNLNILKDRIAVIRQDVFQREGESRSSQTLFPGFEQSVREVKKQIEDIELFLLENPNESGRITTWPTE